LRRAKNSRKSEFISMLVRVVKNKLVADTRFHSLLLKKGSVIFKKAPTTELPCVPSMNNSLQINTPDSSKLNYPFDYIIDDFIYRVDIVEQSIEAAFNKAHMPNLLSRPLTTPI
jgi:hypothetical protein